VILSRGQRFFVSLTLIVVLEWRLPVSNLSTKHIDFTLHLIIEVAHTVSDKGTTVAQNCVVSKLLLQLLHVAVIVEPVGVLSETGCLSVTTHCLLDLSLSVSALCN